MRIKFLQLFVFIFCSSLAFSQNAPEFMVTDSDGENHQLYKDYLDEGKTVLVKIFYTSCPPCNQIAPYLEGLYQEWGAGDHEVEFFELSVQTWDNNVLINNFKNQHGITFPSVGAEGGSVAATAPYRSGDFGFYTGTPTFVVIAPNGSVNFDVTGFGIQGQINALDEALMATGAQKPSLTPIVRLKEQKNEVIVSPNPFLERTEIRITTIYPGQLEYELFDILGNRIQFEQYDVGNSGDFVLQQDYASLRSGTYIVRISLDGNPIKSLKVIKKG